MERQMHFLQSGLQRAEESIFPFVLILNSLILNKPVSSIYRVVYLIHKSSWNVYILEVFWYLTESKKFLAFNCEYPLDFCENT